MYEELKDLGFVVITVALDRSTDDARPWIEAAQPTHPALIDIAHVLADRYNMVNVPTILWIDEHGRIVRPNDVAFGDDRFRATTGLDSAKHLDALRTWVRDGARPFTDDQVRALQAWPSAADQEARAFFGLGEWLYEQGRAASAARHFAHAGELAPHDFTIRRGTMRMVGLDPMGPEFRAMYREWTQAGHPYYRPLPDTAG